MAATDEGMNASSLSLLLLPLLALCIPLSFVLCIPLVSTRQPLQRASQAAQLGLGLALIVAAGGLLPSEVSDLPSAHPALATALGGLVRLDAVTRVMLVLVCFIAVVVVRYSRTYLQGEPEQPRYSRAMLATLAAVTVLALSNNLLVITLAWMGTSLALHQLLTFYRQRPQAQIAAHKKFLLSRLADACMLTVVVLIYRTVGHLDLDAINAWSPAGAVPVSLQVAAVLLVLAVSFKSAQLPFHGWLIQVMEAPTPVSALLHAGVVNIGGLVLIRLAPFVAHSAIAQTLLVLLGTITAVVAALVMMTRVSVKVALAWSTCAQLGFMLVECGLGAWQLALLHLVAHSLYKAHAFLSAGTMVDTWRAYALTPQRQPATIARFFGVSALVLLCVVFSTAVGRTFIADTARPDPTLPAFAILLGLSLSPLVMRAVHGGSRVLSSVTLLSIGITAVYFGVHAAARQAFRFPEPAVLPGNWLIAGVGFVLLFTVQLVLECRPHGRLARKLQPQLFAGLYLDELFTRMTFWLWPPQLKAPQQATQAAGHDGKDTMLPSQAQDASAAETAPADLEAVTERACRLIAPTWPLDRFIAVNPFWEMVDEPLPRVSIKLTALWGARLLMPRSWFREEWRAGRLRDQDLQAALAQSGAAATLADLHALLDSEEPVTTQRARVMDVVDSQRDLAHQMSWRSFITHSTSQFCASYFDDGQGRLCSSREGGLYASWRRQALQDRSPALLMGIHDWHILVRQLPDNPRAVLQLALRDLGIPTSELESYLTSLLLDLNGWAAWCAYQRWTARLLGAKDEHVADLLAIRLAWEWLLLRSGGSSLMGRWQAAIAEWPSIDAAARSAQENDWLLQSAIELAWQREVCQQLARGFSTQAAAEPISVQAIFCIDVRSEVFRRALEAQSSRVQTLGFAGFFGMPIEYQPLGTTHARPQLPGLLAPKFRVTDCGVSPAVAKRRAARLVISAAWRNFKSSALSSFTYVESLGMLSGGSLIADTFGRGRRSAVEHTALTRTENVLRRPKLTARAGGEELTSADRCTLAEGMLRAMSLTQNFARLVLLMGHGSHSRNNPHAAGLDCGACCGQTGEVNARAAAALLNEPEVRRGLSARGIEIPVTTWFLAGLHETTTDLVTLYDLDELPAAHHSDAATLEQWLQAAGTQARRERGPGLGLVGLSDEALRLAITDRASDWAQVRPEWGLANNAAFIVAPRAHSHHLNFAGRAFLHDYRFESDPDFATLELIMTAPMVVTHWINLQYYASTVDNVRYGSGNKVLHNVVGGHLGVFEGNGGDLCIGLPLQSLHNGERWVHTPVRLSVFIEAPCFAIDAILRKHDKVRALVNNEWLHLFQLDVQASTIRAYRRQEWVVLPEKQVR